MKGDNMKWPRFRKIRVFPSEVKPLIRYLNDCGWEGDDCYLTVEGEVAVRLKDEQDMYRYERAMQESGRPRLGRAEMDVLLRIFKVRPKDFQALLKGGE